MQFLVKKKAITWMAFLVTRDEFVLYVLDLLTFRELWTFTRFV
jgi:hypothetical protein